MQQWVKLFFTHHDSNQSVEGKYGVHQIRFAPYFLITVFIQVSIFKLGVLYSVALSEKI